MWQDVYFAFSGAVFTAVLIPSCFNRATEVPRKSSIPTAIMLGVSGIVWMTMGMHLSAALSFFAVGPWIFLAVVRPIRKFREIVTTVQQFEVSLEEAELILAHREWISEQRRRRLGQPEPGEAAQEQAPAGGG